jgi:hypothetical protein
MGDYGREGDTGAIGAYEDERVNRAAELGREAGLAAASWAFDGNTTDETYRRVLEGLDEGDPAVYDLFRLPNLSGEFADDPTPQTLADELEVGDLYRAGAIDMDEECTAWEVAASDAFWQEVERVARY